MLHPITLTSLLLTGKSWLSQKLPSWRHEIRRLWTRMIGQSSLWRGSRLSRIQQGCRSVFSQPIKGILSVLLDIWTKSEQKTPTWVSVCALYINGRNSWRFCAVVRDPKYESRPLEIPDLRSYTFADFDNGTYGFWVAGKAGWFELKDPAVSYRATFDGMNEAAGMFYFMAKKYRNAIAAKWSLHSRTKPYHLTIFKGVRTNQFLAVPSLCWTLK